MALKLPSPLHEGDNAAFPLDPYGRLLGPKDSELVHPPVPAWYKQPEPVLSAEQRVSRLKAINGVQLNLMPTSGLKSLNLSDDQKTRLVRQFFDYCKERGYEFLEGEDHPIEIKVDWAISAGGMVSLAGAVYADTRLTALQFDIRRFQIFTMTVPASACTFSDAEGGPFGDALEVLDLIGEVADRAGAVAAFAAVPPDDLVTDFEAEVDALALEGGDDAVEFLARHKVGAKALADRIDSGEVKIPPVRVGSKEVVLYEVLDPKSRLVQLGAKDFLAAVREELEGGRESMVVEINGLAVLALGNFLNRGAYDLEVFMRETFVAGMIEELKVEAGIDVDITLTEMRPEGFEEMSFDEKLDSPPPSYVLEISLKPDPARVDESWVSLQ